MPEIPIKEVYKLHEVCEATDTQPYVLRFWEGEFPQLGGTAGRGGTKVYRRQDIDLVLRIKRLLHDEEYTIAGARKKLEEEDSRDPSDSTEASANSAGTIRASRREAARSVAGRRDRAGAPVESLAAASEDLVPRERYDDAIDEIEHLRFQLRETEKRLRKLEGSQPGEGAEVEALRQRNLRGAERLERLIALLLESDPVEP